MNRWKAAFAAALLIAAPAHAADKRPLVSAPAGKVEGVVDAGALAFKGLPYAAPPVGEGRWRAPAPAARWNGIRDASQFGAACVQPTPGPPSVYSSEIGVSSEDCLTLNVWTPSTKGKAPVIVWIHGGSLTSGSGKSSLQNGARYAQTGAVLVTINYRLGVLGYMAHPELSKEAPNGVSGNYGLLDQIAALQWVRENISAFGGDPANVTIAGESAGALSVMYLMVSPPAKGLFAKAIAQSAYMISTPELKATSHGAPPGEAAGAYVARVMKAPDLAALRAIDPQVLTDKAAQAGFMPFGAIDGVVLTKQLVDTFDRGEQARVPILTGFNSGEVRSLRFLAPPAPKTAAEYEKTIRERYGDLADDFLKLYPATNLEESILATTRDAFYGWTSERLARSQVKVGQPAFLYLFDHGYPAVDQAGLHAFHASEIPYMFGSLDRVPPRWPKAPETADEKALSDAMVGYWTSFARTGQPRAGGRATWKTYTPDGAYMAFRDKPAADTNLMPGMFAFHERAVCRRKAAGDQPWNWNVGLVSPVLAGPAPACP